MLGFVVRQLRRGALARRLALAGAAVVIGTLAGCGGAVADRVSTGGDRLAESAAVDTAPSRDSQQVVTVDAEPESPDAGGSTTAGAATTSPNAAIEPAGNDSAVTSPEDLSTGPTLEWTEIELDVPYGLSIHATSDGRVVAVGGSPAGDSFPAATHLLVTEDGAAWTQVPLPDDIVLFSVAMSDERIAISASSRAGTAAGGDAADMGVPILVSDDQGATWAEATLDIQTARRGLHDDATVEFSLASVSVSGDYVVAAVQGHVRLNVASLLVDVGLVDTDAHIAGWTSEGDSVRVWLDNSDGTETELRFSHDDLALTDSQRALLGDERGGPLHGGRVFLYGGNDTELAFLASYSGWAGASSATDDGFRLTVSTAEGHNLVASADGESWSVHPLARSTTSELLHVDALAPDGTVWTARFSTTLDGGTGGSVHRWRVGESGTQTAHFPSIEVLHGLAAGPAGLVVGGLAGIDDLDLAGDQSLPEGRLTKDGYELRFNEPEGGVTLWGLTAGEAVYVFDYEAIQGSTTPPGVRSEGNGDSTTLTFEDPETGDDLVTFTVQELLEVMGPLPTIAADAPEQWVGWSADGVRWGWEPAQDAFGLGVTDGVARFAVGEDFVIAMVWLIPSPAFAEGTDADDIGRIPETRWFVGRVR